MIQGKINIPLILGIILFWPANSLSAQLNIDSCYAMAERNYPLVKQYALIEKSRDYSLSNANMNYLPQIMIAGQATYQSDVTRVPVSIPGITIPETSKDQYKLYGEINQPITDLFTQKPQKDLIKSSSDVEGQQVQVEVYKLKERINQLYFSILLLDAQIELTELLKKDIQNALEKINAAIANGVGIPSDADKLKVELIKAKQKTIELLANRQGYVDMLSLFINQPIGETTKFIEPSPKPLTSSINRPELKLFDMQKNIFANQSKLITIKNLPRFNLFFQGGFGRPALNMLSNDFDGYFITGLRLNWNISGFYTFGKEKKILGLKQDIVDVQRETFLFNTQLGLRQQNSEANKLEALILTDSEIIELNNGILSTVKNQLEFGTATTNDYIDRLNAVDKANQNLALHQIQLLMVQYNHATTSGN